MGNPEKALAAALAAPIRVGDWDVQPLTLNFAALLEAVKSPLITGVQTGAVACWIGTLFIMTHSAGESRRLLAEGGDVFEAAADEWAATVTAGTAVALIRAALRQTRVAMGVLPEEDDEDGESKNHSAATAG